MKDQNITNLYDMVLNEVGEPLMQVIMGGTTNWEQKFRSHS
jgi:DNA-binding protein Fis